MNNFFNKLRKYNDVHMNGVWKQWIQLEFGFGITTVITSFLRAHRITERA